MNTAEEAAEDAQYNHATLQRSIANVTVTNAVQQQKITALQSQLQSAISVAQVMCAPSVQQPVINAMLMQQQ